MRGAGPPLHVSQRVLAAGHLRLGLFELFVERLAAIGAERALEVLRLAVEISRAAFEIGERLVLALEIRLGSVAAGGLERCRELGQVGVLAVEGSLGRRDRLGERLLGGRVGELFAQKGAGFIELGEFALVLLNVALGVRLAPDRLVSLVSRELVGLGRRLAAVLGLAQGAP